MNLANNLSIYLGSTILYYYIQPIDGDTVIVNQGYPFTPDLLYLWESYLHRCYQYISKTKQIRAEEIKKGPCKQAVRSCWMYTSKSQDIRYERTAKLRMLLLNIICDK